MAQADNSARVGTSLKFNHLTVDDGLSNPAVITLLQDHQGFLWVGTHGGLNRYDGYDFKIYKHNFDNEGSLSMDFVWILFEDSHHNLWVGTNGGGLNRLNQETGEFTHFRQDPNDPLSLIDDSVLSLLEDASGILADKFKPAQLERLGLYLNPFRKLAVSSEDKTML